MSSASANDHRGPELPTGGNKRQRTCNQTADSSAPLPSHAELLAYAEGKVQQYRERLAAANAARPTSIPEPKSGLSFNTICPRTTNAAQELVRNEYLDWSESLFKFLLDEDEAFDPSAPLWEYINRAHKLMSIENGGRHTYFEERRKKGGGACNGTTRSGYYAELCKKLGLDDPKLVSIINFNNLTVETQRELTKRLLDG